MVSKTSRDPNSEPQSTKWVPRALSKAGSKKTSKKTLFSNLECGLSVVNKVKLDKFQLWILTPSWVSFWKCFGSQNGGQSLQKGTSKKHQQKWYPACAQSGTKGGPKMEPKSSNMRSVKHLVSRVAPKWPPDPLQDRFWRGFGTMLGPCLSVFLTYFCWFAHAFFRSMLRTKAYKRRRNHQKKISENFQERSSLSMPSCIEQFTSER